MTKNGLTVQISKSTGLRQSDVKMAVQMTLDGVVDVLATEGHVELRNFGVFKVKSRGARTARNPRTGGEVMVPAKRVVHLKPGKLMQEKVR